MRLVVGGVAWLGETSMIKGKGSHKYEKVVLYCMCMDHIIQTNKHSLLKRRNNGRRNQEVNCADASGDLCKATAHTITDLACPTPCLLLTCICSALPVQ